MSETTYQVVPLEQLHESPLNPRKHFNAVKLEELAASIRAHGVLTPLLARPNADGFEIAAGHRRYRAAQLAGAGQVPVVVRPMTDEELLEILVVENDQREDVHPLEQAAGYKALMLVDGYDAKRIATRIGRSEKWVYDRVKLLQLIPLAQQLFLAGKMDAGHAILLARLTPEQQGKALEVDEDDYRSRSGLFVSESVELFDDEDGEPKKATKKDPLAPFAGFKAKSVRELDDWISEHVRFDAAKADAFLFPAAAEAAREAPKALVPLTRNSHVQDDARDSKVRTWRPGSWKDATKSPCKYTQDGIFVVGEGRGDVLKVCLSSHRDQCPTHWAKEKKEAEARRKQMARGGSRTTRADNTYEKQEARRRAEEATEAALSARFKTAAPAIVTAIALAIDNAPLGTLGKELLDYVAPDRYDRPAVKLEDYHAAGRTADTILRHVAFYATLRDASSHRLAEELARAGKTWGVDVKAILDKEAPVAKAEKPAASAKKKAKR